MRSSFTEVTAAIPPRARLTARLRAALAEAIAGSNRAVSEVAAAHRVSWPTAHRALIAAAARWLPEPEPVRVLGIDETRTRSVRWVLADAGWKPSDPWMTSFVNAETSVPGRLLGLAPGRSGACVRTWLAEQSSAFRDGVQIAVIDPLAPYASGIRASLPQARIAVDKWHLVSLANDMLTQVRQRATRAQQGRRGTSADPIWVNRQLLLTGAERLSTKQWLRLKRTLAIDDPTNEIAAALGRQGATTPATCPARPRPDPRPPVPVLLRRRGLSHARDHPPREHHRDLVARGPGRPHQRRHQRPDRGLQPDHQAGQARRMRVHQHGKLPKAHHGPHRDHQTATGSGMTRGAPLKVEELETPAA